MTSLEKTWRGHVALVLGSEKFDFWKNEPYLH